MKFEKPFLKWVGGKTQIIDEIISRFPSEMENYHEPFLGGGSVLLALLSMQKNKKITIKGQICAYDINPYLIHVYQNIQSNKDELYKYIEQYISVYDSLKGTEVNRKALTLEEAKTSKESYYYWMRKRYNTMDKNAHPEECSALFMILNKTCFRGMYREGPNGYNVPYGHYKKTPTIITRETLDYMSDLIKDVTFIHSDFRETLKNVKEGDFVYLDPPYAPETSRSFVGYVADGFTLEMHKTLFEEIKKVKEKGAKIVMSNAKVDMVVDAFKGYQCDEIEARRAINSKKPGSTTTEVIIYN